MEYKFKIGDLVEIVCNTDETALEDFQIGSKAEVLNVWEGENYPYELLGSYENFKEIELKLAA